MVKLKSGEVQCYKYRESMRQRMKKVEGNKISGCKIRHSERHIE